MRYYSLILILSLVSCQNLTSDRIEFICENGNKKIIVEVENGMNSLTYNELSKANFVVTNIDPINLRIAGPGIKIIGTNKDKTAMQTEIKILPNYLDNDTLNIKVWYDNQDNQKKCEFKIPVKKAEQK